MVAPPFLFSWAASLACLLAEVFERHGSLLVFRLDDFGRRLGVIRFQVKSALLQLGVRSHLKGHVVFLIQVLGFQFFAGAESVVVLTEAALLAGSYYLYSPL